MALSDSVTCTSTSPFLPMAVAVYVPGRNDGSVVVAVAAPFGMQPASPMVNALMANTLAPPTNVRRVNPRWFLFSDILSPPVR